MFATRVAMTRSPACRPSGTASGPRRASTTDGSGKSTVAAMLEHLGAVVFDADDFARQAVMSGTPGFRHVVETFGRRVVGEDGELDRARLASVVFDSDEDRLRLEAIVHPEVAR